MKAEEGYNGIMVGRLKMLNAKAIKRRCADIYLSKETIVHIEKKHNKELRQLGIDAISYVSLITKNYNQIRQGSGTSILLIIFSKDLIHTAAIDLNYCVKKGVWEVKTAQPRKIRDIMKRKLLK